MTGFLDDFVTLNRARSTLIVQPRMGFGQPQKLRAGLRAVADLGLAAVGTLTLDSYTRVGDYETPLQRLADGEELNGYPLVSHPVARTRDLLAGLNGPGFPVQVRHGTSLPRRIFERLVEVGLDATEGGPVSYCLPYGQVPLSVAIEEWAESCRFLAGETEHGHVESFGGCLLGQLCPPSFLVAMTLLEGCFFRQHGLRRMSLSYAQGTHGGQDRGALRALRDLAPRYLGDSLWHVVMYTYMGVFPRTAAGAMQLVRDSARIARDTGCERLIVKTVAESRQIPSIDDNLDALRLAASASTGVPAGPTVLEEEFRAEIRHEAALIVDAVLGLDPDIGIALERAFELGLLDVPFCPHPDNRAATTCLIDERGVTVWGAIGGLPLPRSVAGAQDTRIGSERLRTMLFQVADRYDAQAVETGGSWAACEPGAGDGGGSPRLLPTEAVRGAK